MPNLRDFILVFFGAGLGGVLRLSISSLSALQIFSVFPLNTLVINILGSFLMGICLRSFEVNLISKDIRLLFATGILGGFTTFSTFTAESFILASQGYIIQFSVYILTSTLLGILFFWLGYKGLF